MPRPMSKNSSESFFHSVFPSRIEAVDDACGEIRRRLLLDGLERVCFSVDLLTREFLKNAIVHGNGSDAQKVVTLTMRIGTKWICLQVMDEGPGFDWRKARRTPPKASTIHGRGLSIGALYAHRMKFNRRGNQVTLWINKNG